MRLFVLAHFAGSTVWYRAGNGNWCTTLLDNADLYESPLDLGPGWIAIEVSP